MESDTSSTSSNDVDDDELLDAAEVMCVAEAVLAWICNRMTLGVDSVGKIMFRC